MGNKYNRPAQPQPPQQPSIMSPNDFKEASDKHIQQSIEEYNNFIQTKYRTHLKEQIRLNLEHQIGQYPPLKFNMKTDGWFRELQCKYISKETDAKIKQRVLEELFAETKWKLVSIGIIKCSEFADTWMVEITYPD